MAPDLQGSEVATRMSDRGKAPKRVVALKRLPALVPVLAFAILSSSSASAAVTCDRVAAPTGSDSNQGTTAEPFRTAQKLVDSLSPGHTGCLKSGTYAEDVKVSRGGVRGSRITIRSFPSERATLVGRLWIAEGSDYVTFSNLNLDGSNATNLPSPTVNANYVIFRHNDITNNNTAICLLLGSMRGRANRALIARNRIHNCGRLPAANHDHGIYISLSKGSVIRNNFIYDNADRGIQLYPNAQRTRIHDNVIDGNGQGIIFSGADGVASNNNVVKYNIITNSKIRHNVESYYSPGNPIGRGNRVRRNCVYGGVRNSGNGSIQEPQIGFTATGNIIADPMYRNRAKKDFRLRRRSPCRPIRLRAGAAKNRRGRR